MKIAICLSGQPRVAEYTIPSILNFFSGEHEYDFFCHSWNYNSYKRKTESPEPNQQPIWWEQDTEVDTNEVYRCLSALGPKKCVVDSKQVFRHSPFMWHSMSYSMMYANHLKKQYELENNFRYDYVVKSRYDIVFPLGDKFTISPNANTKNYLDIFTCHAGRAPNEFNRINASDVLLYGSSLGMDILTELYRNIQLKESKKRLDDYESMGPGTYISYFGDKRNLKFHNSHIRSTVYRKEIIPANPLNEFEAIWNYNHSFYLFIPSYD